MEKEKLQIRQNGDGETFVKNENGDWREHKLFILETLKDLKDSDKEQSKCLKSIDKNISALNVKSGVWGVLGGIAVFLVIYLKDKLFK